MDYTIENLRPRHDFALIPQRLVSDHTLSATARLALIHMCSQPTGWITRVSEVRAVLGVGDKAWRRISRELRDRGAMQLREHADRRTGRVYGRRLVVSWEPWLGTPDTSETGASAQHVDKSTEAPKRDVAETGADHRRKPAPTTAEKGPNYPERKIKKDAPSRRDADLGEACSLSEGRTEAAGRGQDFQEPDDERVLPSLQRRREIARELGLTPDAALCPGLSDADGSDHA